MSDLTGMDEEDKDADPVMNTLDLLQEPLRSQMSLFKSNACRLSMEQNPIAYMNTFDRHQSSVTQNSSVLDVLSNTDMLSGGPMVNGPSSHQALQSVDLQSLSTEKDEEKSITQLKTVQNIDTTGIWGFDVESSESSLDNYDSANDLSWDPQREFMQFLWENHDDSPAEDEPELVTPPASQRRRKRKMDMVVMVDPSEDLYPNLSLKSTEVISDEDSQADPVPINKLRKLRKRSKPQSPTGKKAQHPNGTAESVQLKYSVPVRNLHEKSRLVSPKRNPSTDSCSEEEPLFFPCTKCTIHFKEKSHLQRHMRCHPDPPSQISMPKPFICKECGQSFRNSNTLLRHMTIHEERRERLIEEIKGMNDLKDEGKNARLQCPQCNFGTNCANTFVQHAKTHEKDKWYYDCEKCNFLAASMFELERHMSKEHSVCKDQEETEKHSIFMPCNDETPISFSCTICSYSTTSKNIFKNHIGLRHHQSYAEYEALQNTETIAESTSKQHSLSCKAPLVDSCSSALTSKFCRENSPCEPNDISDLFKKDKIVNRVRKDVKSQITESKLDKSINILLSRQKRRDETLQEEKPDVTTELSVFQDVNGDINDGDFKGVLAVPSENSNCSSNGHKRFSFSKLDKRVSNSGYDANKHNSKDVSRQVFEQKVGKKYPSKRKMSTPYRNAVDQESCFIISRYMPSPKRQNMVEDMEDSDEKEALPLSDSKLYTSSQLLDKTEIKQETSDIGSTFSRRMSVRGTSEGSLDKVLILKTGSNCQQKPVVKEERIETQVFEQTFESSSVQYNNFTDADLSTLDMERKTCPYCPAVFESGVGLSNHVRGHLHRVGLSYNARHVVPPEQVASQDKRPRIRRRMAAIRRLKKAFRLESSGSVSSHSCPLCGDSFDNKTGQSNHIRGHLKRLGKSISTKNKSPLCLLRELMRDKKEFQRALQIVGRKRKPSQGLKAIAKQAGVDCLSSPSVGISKRNPIQNLYNDAKSVLPTFSLLPEASSKKQVETKLEVKGSLSSALIGILKKRKCQDDKLRTSQTSRNAFAGPSTSAHSTGSRATTTLPNSTSEKGEFNRKVCVHCNATFHSGVSLSNHLRAYAKRKRTALLEGTTFDCKQRRQRSRPGSKKKISPVPHTPEEMYRLTCRFCDLVFQGPLSVQEDWIKHLQRHIMNTSVPHTGASMVEVTSLPKDPPSPTTDQQNLPLTTHTAS
ncbi:zinc finger protein 644a [Osmerus mordax]|uniref:zinc finger protein 644a n=1 Tax=Osmerus mordax TaxID=8014 RepID=UPI00350EE127